MSSPRIVLPFSQENYQRVKQKRKKELVLKSLLQFLSGLGLLAGICDVGAIFGVQIIVGTALSLSTFLFLGVLGVAIIGGAFWAVKKSREYDCLIKKEKSLMEKCNFLFIKQTTLINRLKLYDPKFDIEDLLQKQILKADEEREMTVRRFFKKGGNRSMSFLSGAGTTLGIAGLIVGAFGASMLIASPLGWVLLASIIAASIMVGVATVYVDYYLEKNQKKRIKELKKKILKLKKTNRKLKIYCLEKDWEYQSQLKEGWRKLSHSRNSAPKHKPHIENCFTKDQSLARFSP